METMNKVNLHSVLGDMPPDEFRRFGHQLIDWIADHFKNINSVSVLPDLKPGQIRKTIPPSPPKIGESMEKILDDIDTVIMPGMTHWNHPNFFAYFSITGSGPGILGELLSAALNVNAMLWKTCPAATELEQITLDWLRQLVGLPKSFWGIIYDTASVSTLHAIAAAREQVPGWNIREKGLSGRKKLSRLRLYASDQAHSSVDKAAITLGLGLDGLRKIPSDATFRLIPSALIEAIHEDRKNGWIPFCTVATVGTTSTTSIDPVPQIANICQSEGLWLHVDAAYGGSAAIIPEMRTVLEGCELADSIVMNPHKWLFVPIDLSAFYTRKPNVLKKAFCHVAEYLKTSEDSKVDNLMDYGVQLGRRFRALKLWFVLRYFGQEGLVKRIQSHLDYARMFASWIEDHPDFEVMAPVPFSTVCFRARPGGWEKESLLNRLNASLLDAINETREVFLSHTKLGSRYVLRAAFGNLHTRKEHIQRMWDIVQDKLPEVLSGMDGI
jgi:aromatic-L-amino-acid decarboxylase